MLPPGRRETTARVALQDAYAAGIRAVAIAFMHSYRYPAHEHRVAEIARMLGGASLTSVVAQHARELLALAASDSPKKK